MLVLGKRKALEALCPQEPQGLQKMFDTSCVLKGQMTCCPRGPWTEDRHLELVEIQDVKGGVVVFRTGDLARHWASSCFSYDLFPKVQACAYAVLLGGVDGTDWANWMKETGRKDILMSFELLESVDTSLHGHVFQRTGQSCAWTSPRLGKIKS
jgi:hypothetical protein